ncbi:MAG: tyrosine-protein phosphatase [Anaerolineae bacterium]|nr:tyrosine-protein phosphatase [Anaerolineae bacterium]
MPFLRTLSLPSDIPGSLYLSGMPGRYGMFERERDAITAQGIDTVLCLTPHEEIEKRSPAYAAAIALGEIPWKQWIFPIPDFDAPDDREAFLEQIRAAADHLRQGGKLLAHCTAGIGRTGLAATCLLMALGVNRQTALDTVRAAGSRPEAPEQQALIEWMAQQFGR